MFCESPEGIDFVRTHARRMWKLKQVPHGGYQFWAFQRQTKTKVSAEPEGSGTKGHTQRDT